MFSYKSHFLSKHVNFVLLYRHSKIILHIITKDVKTCINLICCSRNDVFRVCFGSVRCQSSRKHQYLRTRKSGMVDQPRWCLCTIQKQENPSWPTLPAAIGGWCKNLLPVCFHNLNSKHGQKKMWFCWAGFPQKEKYSWKHSSAKRQFTAGFPGNGLPNRLGFDLDKNDKDNNYSVSALGKTITLLLLLNLHRGGTNVGQSQTVITIIKNYKSRVFSSCFLCLFWWIK